MSSGHLSVTGAAGSVKDWRRDVCTRCGYRVFIKPGEKQKPPGRSSHPGIQKFFQFFVSSPCVAHTHGERQCRVFDVYTAFGLQSSTLRGLRSLDLSLIRRRFLQRTCDHFTWRAQPYGVCAPLGSQPYGVCDLFCYSSTSLVLSVSYSCLPVFALICFLSAGGVVN